MNGLLFLIFSCLLPQTPADSLLARSGPLEFHLHDFRDFLGQVAKRGIGKPEDMDRVTWHQLQFEQWAVIKIFEAHPQVASVLATPEFKQKVHWQVVQQLAQAQKDFLSTQIPPMPEQALQKGLDEKRQQNLADLHVTFRHIFLRKDHKRQFETIGEVDQFAQKLRERAKAGENFETLAKTYSQSAQAAKGGLVKNSRLAELDSSLRDLFTAMKPGEISDVISTRTGFHLFKMEHKGTPYFDKKNTAKLLQSTWLRLKLEKALKQHIATLTNQIQITDTATALRSPSWQFSKKFLRQAVPQFDQPKGNKTLRAQLLLAEAAIGRGLKIDEFQSDAQERKHKALAEKHREASYQEFLNRLPLARVRSIYDAQPQAFGEAAKANIHLIFQPQGKDGFKTQRRMETLVAELRKGFDFQEAARTYSKDPSAANGGNLGVLPFNAWAEIHPHAQTAIQKLKNGEISDPIYCSSKRVMKGSTRVSDGFIIVKVENKQPGKQLPLEAVEARVRHAYAVQNRGQLQREWRQATLKRAGLEMIKPIPPKLVP